jgi:hypothetical protein
VAAGRQLAAVVCPEYWRHWNEYIFAVAHKLQNIFGI